MIGSLCGSRMSAFATVLVAVLLAACGGGQGGSDQAQAIGLVPTAPTPGAVLYSDAAPFRPLNAGAQWMYLGIQGSYLIGQSADGQGRLDESIPPPPYLAKKAWLDAGGNVGVRVTLRLPNVGDVSVEGIELPKVLRQGEQFAAYEVRIPGNFDADSDGKPDAVDLAVWSRVTGTESLTLPNESQSVRTLRVDRWHAYRTVLSGGGFRDVQTWHYATWYLAGVGPVRYVEFRDATGQEASSDLMLGGYVDQQAGRGVVVHPPELDATGQPLVPAYYAQGPYTLPLVDGALVYSGSAVYTVDLRGRITSGVPWGRPGQAAQAPKWVRLASGIRQLEGLAFADMGLVPFSVWSLDNSGRYNGNQPLAQVDLRSASPDTYFESAPIITALPGGDRFWMVWRRHFQAVQDPSTGDYTTPPPQIIVRALGADGKLLTDEVALPVSTAAIGADRYRLRAQALGQGVQVSWAEGRDVNDNPTENRLALVSNEGVVVADRRFPLCGGWNTGLAMLTDGSTPWAVWWGPTVDGDFVGRPHAWRLDALGQVVSSDVSMQGVCEATLSGLGLEYFDGVDKNVWSGNYATDGRLWWGSGAFDGLLWPGAIYGERHLTFFEADPGTGAPATGLTIQRSWTVPVTRSRVPPIVFPDRILLLGDDGQGLRPAVVWR